MVGGQIEYVKDGGGRNVAHILRVPGALWQVAGVAVTQDDGNPLITCIASEAAHFVMAWEYARPGQTDFAHHAVQYGLQRDHVIGAGGNYFHASRPFGPLAVYIGREGTAERISDVVGGLGNVDHQHTHFTVVWRRADAAPVTHEAPGAAAPDPALLMLLAGRVNNLEQRLKRVEDNLDALARGYMGQVSGP
jgi:hypothetical protein